MRPVLKRPHGGTDDEMVAALLAGLKVKTAENEGIKHTYRNSDDIELNAKRDISQTQIPRRPLFGKQTKPKLNPDGRTWGTGYGRSAALMPEKNHRDTYIQA
jgi:hypothetical protein